MKPGGNMATRKTPGERMQELQEQNHEYYRTEIGSRSSMTKDYLEFWMPSGATAKIPKHEVLALRDLCNSWMSQNGALDIMGREVDWQRPHPPVQTEGTEPSDTAPQDAG